MEWFGIHYYGFLQGLKTVEVNHNHLRTTQGEIMSNFIDLVGPLDGTSRFPLYEQLHRKIRKAIEERILEPEAVLPPERDLASAFDVSRITIRKALEGLVSEGLLTRRQGVGTFVASRVEKNFSQLTSFSEDMISRGSDPSSVWLKRVKDEVTLSETMTYGLEPGLQIYRLNRLRFADGAPMALEYAIIPASCLTGIEDVQDSLYDALGRTDFRPVRALQRLRAVLLTKKQADLLEADVNDAGLLVERRGFLADGRIIEIARSYYRGDTYDFVAELSR